MTDERLTGAQIRRTLLDAWADRLRGETPTSITGQWLKDYILREQASQPPSGIFDIRFDAAVGEQFDPEHPPYEVGQVIDIPYRTGSHSATVTQVEVTDDRRSVWVSLKDL